MDSRRDFIKKTACGVMALNAPLVWSSSKTRPVTEEPKKSTLVVVFLRGGADPLNVIVPFHDPDYYALRPTISIARPGSRPLPEGERPCLPLDRHFGLHPSLESLIPLWQNRQLAPILNVGSTHPTRSHFDAQDFMEWAAPGIKSIQEGWLNRYLKATSSPNDHFLRAFSPQPLLPRALRGEYSVLAAPGAGSKRALDVFDDLYDLGRPPAPQPEPSSPTPPEDPAKQKPASSSAEEESLDRRLERAGATTVEKLRHLNGILKQSKEARKKYPRGGLGRQFADVAAVIKAGEPIEIAGIDYNGWDHHSYQGGSRGQQANMLRNLADSIAAFVQDVGPERMQRVTILTMTEFGRTVAENGTQGSDHGHGGFMLAIGGKVNGGRVHGKWTGLNPRRLYMQRDLPVYTDFRDVFDTTLKQLFSFETESTDFFPGYERPRKNRLELYRT